MDAIVSECRRGDGSKHDVCDQNPSIPVGAVTSLHKDTGFQYPYFFAIK